MDEFPQGFVCQNMIDHPDEERCELTAADVEDLKKFFPKTAEFLEPNALMTSDCASEEWVCFLEYPFLIGLTFPFPPFILRFFEKTGLAFAQLMPVGWRNLVTLGRLSAEMNMRIDLEELGFCYDLRSHGNKRFGFRVKSRSNSLVTDSIDRDRKWKNRFFYVKKSTLEHMEKINSFWLDEALKLDELFPKRADTLSVVASVVALSPRKQKFLRPATPSGEEEVEEVEEEEKSSNKALQIATVMSTDTTSQPSVGGVSSLIARFKKPKKEVAKPNIPKDEGTKPKLMLGDIVSFKKRKSEIVDVDAGEPIEEVLAQKTLKFLLHKPSIKANGNAVNVHGFTPLDTMDHCPRDLKALETREILIEAGIKKAKDLKPHPKPNPDPSPTNNSKSPQNISNPQKKFPSRIWNNYANSNTHWVEKERGNLIIAAAIISAMTFQAGINPPGGTYMDSINGHNAGMSVAADVDIDTFSQFLTFNTVPLTVSMLIILILVSGINLRNKFVIWVLMLGMFTVFVFLLVAYMQSIALLSPDMWVNQAAAYLCVVWIVIAVVFAGVYTVFFVVWLVAKCVAKRRGIRTRGMSPSTVVV